MAPYSSSHLEELMMQSMHNFFFDRAFFITLVSRIALFNRTRREIKDEMNLRRNANNAKHEMKQPIDNFSHWCNNDVTRVAKSALGGGGQSLKKQWHVI